jgi:hypothetical protein
MKIKLCLMALAMALTTTGCVAVGAGAGAYLLVKEVTKRRPRLNEMQRRQLECREINGRRDDVLKAIVTVYQDRGYAVQSSDYEGGIVTAMAKKPRDFKVTATVEEFTQDRAKIRITMSDQNGVLEDAQLFAQLFDNIKAEVFRRANLNK